MSEQLFKLQKVFNCTDMPKEVRDYFFDNVNCKTNDVYVEWSMYDTLIFDDELAEMENPKILKTVEFSEGDKGYIIEGIDPVSDWLCQNGAEDDEVVIIKHWW